MTRTQNWWRSGLIATLLMGAACAPEPPETSGALPDSNFKADSAAMGGRTVQHISGQVLGNSGPEAGVWVIAETDDFDTRFARIVVTDDDGRYLIPDLPAASYRLWVRGYGLADSDPSLRNPATR